MPDSKQKIESKNSNLIELKGNSNINHRIDYIKMLYSTADVAVSHLDNIRQRNLMVALGVFGGFFTIMINTKSFYQALSYQTVNFVFMMILYYRDRNLHKYSEGWQSTRRKLAIALASMINNPDEKTNILRYDGSAEKRGTKKIGWTDRTYILLVRSLKAKRENLPTKTNRLHIGSLSEDFNID